MLWVGEIFDSNSDLEDNVFVMLFISDLLFISYLAIFVSIFVPKAFTGHMLKVNQVRREKRQGSKNYGYRTLLKTLYVRCYNTLNV